MSEAAHGDVARFGAFELDTTAAELRRSGRLVALTGQPMRVLIRLASRAGGVVTREELQREIWGQDTHVDFEAGLSTCINQIRVALGDRAAAPRFVETLPRRGYRFVAPVEWGRPAPAAPASGARSRAGIAVAAASVLALSMWSIASVPARAAAPLGMVVVIVDPSRAELEPVSRTLQDALIGALATEAGERARFLSPLATQEIANQPFEQAQKTGIGFRVYVTLRSLGGSTLVHVKLVGRDGSVRWTANREMTPEELERGTLLLAREFSKPLVEQVVRQADRLESLRSDWR